MKEIESVKVYPSASEASRGVYLVDVYLTQMNYYLDTSSKAHL